MAFDEVASLSFGAQLVGCLSSPSGQLMTAAFIIGHLNWKLVGLQKQRLFLRLQKRGVGHKIVVMKLVRKCTVDVLRSSMSTKESLDVFNLFLNFNHWSFLAIPS